MIKKRRRVKACVFDLGNTLINDTQLTKESVRDLSQWMVDQFLIPSGEVFISNYMRANHEIDKPFISHTFGEIEFFEKTFQEMPLSGISANDALDKYRAILTEKIHPDTDVVDAFTLLKEKNIRIALLSNESVHRVDTYMEKTSLRHFFDTIIVSEDIGIEKPDLRIFEETLKRLSIKGDEMVMFGDNEISDGASKELGIFFVLVTTYRNKDWVWEKGAPYRPDYIMQRINRKNMEIFLDKINNQY